MATKTSKEKSNSVEQRCEVMPNSIVTALKAIDEQIKQLGERKMLILNTFALAKGLESWTLNYEKMAFVEPLEDKAE